MEDLSRNLATTLTQFQKSPGRDDRWVEKVTTTMQSAWPEEHERLARLVGFSSRLAALAGFRGNESAASALGAFFYTLNSGELVEGAAPSNPWSDYFGNNHDALEPALEVARSMNSRDGEGWGGPAATVARISLLFENETKTRKRGPLQLLHNLREQAETPVMERVVEALWTEEGQELCGQNARGAHLRDSELAALLTESLKQLKASAPKARPASSDAAPIGPLSAPIRGSNKRGASELVASLASATSERKKALRASLIPDETPADDEASEEHTPEQEALAALVTSIDGRKTSRPRTSPPELTDEQPEPELMPESNEPADAADAQEVWRDRGPARLTSIKKEQPAMLTDGRDGVVAEKLSALRQRLERIERSAGEAQALLSELGPQLDEVYAWVSELDDVLSRWTRPRAAI